MQDKKSLLFFNSSDRFFSVSTFDLFPNLDHYNGQYYKTVFTNDYKKYFPYKWSKLIKKDFSCNFLNNLNKLHHQDKNKLFHPFEAEFREPISYNSLFTLRQLINYSSTEFYFKDIKDAFALTHHKHRSTFMRDLKELLDKGYIYVRIKEKGKYFGKYYYEILNPKGEVINQ